jgi:hypothetical protein
MPLQGPHDTLTTKNQLIEKLKTSGCRIFAVKALDLLLIKNFLRLRVGRSLLDSLYP